MIVHIYIYISKIQIFAYINIDKHFGKSSHSRQHTIISVYDSIYHLDDNMRSALIKSYK